MEPGPGVSGHAASPAKELLNGLPEGALGRQGAVERADRGGELGAPPESLPGRPVEDRAGEDGGREGVAGADGVADRPRQRRRGGLDDLLPVLARREREGAGAGASDEDLPRAAPAGELCRRVGDARGRREAEEAERLERLLLAHLEDVGPVHGLGDGPGVEPRPAQVEVDDAQGIAGAEDRVEGRPAPLGALGEGPEPEDPGAEGARRRTGPAGLEEVDRLALRDREPGRPAVEGDERARRGPVAVHLQPRLQDPGALHRPEDELAVGVVADARDEEDGEAERGQVDGHVERGASRDRVPVEDVDEGLAEEEDAVPDRFGEARLRRGGSRGRHVETVRDHRFEVKL